MASYAQVSASRPDGETFPQVVHTPAKPLSPGLPIHIAASMAGLSRKPQLHGVRGIDKNDDVIEAFGYPRE